MKFSERQLESRDIHIDKVRPEKSHPKKLSRRDAKQGSECAWGCERQQFRNRRLSECLGNVDAAIEQFSAAIRLSPIDPHLFPPQIRVISAS
jgi:hypothetical protein